MKRMLVRIVPLLLPWFCACGAMSVKAKAVGETRYAPNPNKDLRFYAVPLDGMEAVGVIEIEGANFDKYQDVRTRASEEAAKMGADALLVVREIRQDGSYWQQTDSYVIGDVKYTEFSKIRADYPVCIYIGVRQASPK